MSILKYNIKILHDCGDDEQTGYPDEADGEHGETDVLGFIEIAADMSSHVAIDSAEDNKDEVEGLNTEKFCQLNVTYLDVSRFGVNIGQICLIIDIMDDAPDRDDEKLNANQCKNCDNLTGFWCQHLFQPLFNETWTHV